MNLGDRYFYRAITAVHFLFMVLVINFFYWMGGSFFRIGGYSKDIFCAYLLSLIFKESLIYVAYGKKCLLDKWQQSTKKIIRLN